MLTYEPTSRKFDKPSCWLTKPLFPYIYIYKIWQIFLLTYKTQWFKTIFFFLTKDWYCSCYRSTAPLSVGHGLAWKLVQPTSGDEGGGNLQASQAEKTAGCGAIEVWWADILLMATRNSVNSPVEVGSWNPMIYKVLACFPGGAGFLPSAVWIQLDMNTIGW